MDEKPRQEYKDLTRVWTIVKLVIIIITECLQEVKKTGLTDNSSCE